MAEEFGSSEGCVTDEEIFFRGKKNAVHEYKHFENIFRSVLVSVRFEMLQVLKQ